MFKAYSIHNSQEENSVRFTPSFHKSKSDCPYNDTCQCIYRNLKVNFLFITSFILLLKPWNRGSVAILILVVVYRDTIMNFQTIQKVSVSPLKRALRSSGKRAAKKALKRASFKRSSVQTGSTAASHAHGRYYFSPRGPQQSIGSGRCSS